MQSITLNFVSLAALAAAVPSLQKLEGLVVGNAPSTSATAKPSAQTAHTPSTASVEVAAASDTKQSSTASVATQSSTQTYTFDEVKSALGAYHKTDATAFNGAMLKFGFKNMNDVEKASDKWTELMQYLGADMPAAPASDKAYTLDDVKAKLMAFATKDQGAFGKLMGEHALKGFGDVQTRPDLWADLCAAADKALA